MFIYIYIYMQENIVSFKILHLTNREALTVLCSVIKHTGSG